MTFSRRLQSTVNGASAGGGTVDPPPGDTSLTVDFATPTYPLSDYSLGSTISTYYGGGNANINTSATWPSGLAELGPLAWRIPFRYNGGFPGSAAAGAQTTDDAAAYIGNIAGINGLPVVVVGGDATDNDFTAEDAAGLVHYFNDYGGQHGGPIQSWIIGNEYTASGNDPIGYQSHLNEWAAAMKAADPTITISAPAAPDMTSADDAIGASVTNASDYLDYLGYHAYQGETGGLAATSDYETYANHYRDTYITADNFGARATQVAPALEEFNWARSYTGQTEFYDWHNTVYVASVIGHSLAAGAHAYHYADSNGALGLMNDGSGTDDQPGSFGTKFPAYWGIAMWTGLGGTFRRFGSSMVATSSTVDGVEVFATNNGKIVLINKGTSAHAVTLGFGGMPAAGVYDLWQTDRSAPLDAPTKVGDAIAYTDATIDLTLPAGTVSSLELN